jgi:hypothetical protein
MTRFSAACSPGSDRCAIGRSRTSDDRSSRSSRSWRSGRRNTPHPAAECSPRAVRRDCPASPRCSPAQQRTPAASRDTSPLPRCRTRCTTTVRDRVSPAGRPPRAWQPRPERLAASRSTPSAHTRRSRASFRSALRAWSDRITAPSSPSSLHPGSRNHGAECMWTARPPGRCVEAAQQGAAEVSYCTVRARHFSERPVQARAVSAHDLDAARRACRRRREAARARCVCVSPGPAGACGEASPPR